MSNKTWNALCWFTDIAAADVSQQENHDKSHLTLNIIFIVVFLGATTTVWGVFFVSGECDQIMKPDFGSFTYFQKRFFLINKKKKVILFFELFLFCLTAVVYSSFAPISTVLLCARRHQSECV